MSDQHTDRNHKGDFQSLIHSQTTWFLPPRRRGRITRTLKAIESKSDIAPIVAACRPNPNAQSTSEAG
ncbi:hypothetical protein V1294_003651 [Bradyrhizobium sp. AZCC 1678]|uniref:Uncharacterized protein n=1 Tax=Bradyrhizobium algeriense TaxID=634784 RepID=A0ABU8BCP3_9BRAD